MASCVTKEENVRCLLKIKQEMYEHWLKNAPKIMFGEHQLSIEINDEIGEFFVQKAREELRETPEVVAQSLKELKELLAEESDLHILDDDEFYTMFLRPCKWYAKSAFKLIQRFYRFRKVYPHIYSDLLVSKTKLALCADLIYPLPHRTNGSRVLMIEGGKRWKPKEVSINEFFKGLLLVLNLAMVEYRTQIAGTHIIIDVEGLSLSHLTYITPTFAKMLLDFIQRCLPSRLKGIHVVNQSFIFNMAFAIFKPFIEEKIRKRIHFHGTNWESLMGFIDKKALLKRHGGELEMPEAKYGERFWQNMLSCEPAFEADQRYGYITNKDNI